MKLFYRIIADVICLIHLFVILVALFGWLVPSIWYLYMVTLAVALLSDLVYGYCILSKWEFDLRKKIDPATNYDFAWTTYYTHKFSKANVSNNFFEKISLIFLALSLFINIYFRFFVK